VGGTGLAFVHFFPSSLHQDECIFDSHGWYLAGWLLIVLGGGGVELRQHTEPRSWSVSRIEAGSILQSYVTYHIIRGDNGAEEERDLTGDGGEEVFQNE